MTMNEKEVGVVKDILETYKSMIVQITDSQICLIANVILSAEKEGIDVDAHIGEILDLVSLAIDKDEERGVEFIRKTLQR